MLIKCENCGAVNDEDASVLWITSAEGHDFCTDECRRAFAERQGKTMDEGGINMDHTRHP